MSYYQRSGASPYYLPLDAQPYQHQYKRSTSARAQIHTPHDWVCMSDNLHNDMRAMMEDMKTRRKQWQEEREKMREERQGGDA
jgi:hypothetical protein